MTAAQSEILFERKLTSDARGLVQARNANIARLEKRMDELKTLSHARNVLLASQKVSNARIQGTAEHFKCHLEERESTLENKELTILSLRRKNVTLDNFRSVLDHYVQRATIDHEPISEHLRGLEAHISAMYEELDVEYLSRKHWRRSLASKDLQLQTLQHEICRLRGNLRERDSYVTSLKRELAALFPLTTKREIEAAVKSAYIKYVAMDES